MAIAQNNPITANDVITALNVKADFNHNHDGGYYTESEFDSILNEVMPPPAEPELTVIGLTPPSFRIKNNDTRSVTFYYKASDTTISNTNYDGFVTLAPGGLSEKIPITPNVNVYVRGYIRGIPGPVKFARYNSGGGAN